VLTVCIAIALLAVVVLVRMGNQMPVSAYPSQERTIQMVAGEFDADTTGGKEIESYRWDPGTIIVRKGQPVKLSIYGVNGTKHPFYIEGLNVKGEVVQGKETIVSFTPTSEGTYRLICQAHYDIAHNGPMIAYIEVVN
jgi:heme/copper-type cytochrome/quinol oxidase subunit 2